ncbi:dUTP diphosphatase [Bacillus thuringiensis]|uniref:dUTP diphosphatase n=1 Tax=Bacillus thuringiensis TaxID=1428 RepID=A0A9X7GFS5_BACTU|nr:dUTP diphosphatase [Bacillus thuringiensis]PFV35690.1 dUTP diphosphatase [Bacillus thuringiensis]
MELTQPYLDYQAKVNRELELRGNLLVKLIETTDESFVPQRKYPSDAGFDCRARIKESIVIEPGKRACIPLGFGINIPMHHTGDLRPRSGLTKKNGVMAAYGTIDTGYTGEVQANIFNFGDEPFYIEPGDRIAQLVVSPLAKPNKGFLSTIIDAFRTLFKGKANHVATMKLVDELVELERKNSGFGSTGVA